MVLTRPGNLLLEDSLPGEIPLPFRDVRLFEGGPVQPTALSYLYSNPGHLLGNVLPQLTVGHQIEELQDLMTSGSPNLRLKVFSGYAGWAPGQLDNEMRQNSWLTAPADLSLVLEVPPHDLWKRLLRQRTQWQERILADAPEDIAFN